MPCLFGTVCPTRHSSDAPPSGHPVPAEHLHRYIIVGGGLHECVPIRCAEAHDVRGHVVACRVAREERNGGQRAGLFVEGIAGRHQPRSLEARRHRRERDAEANARQLALWRQRCVSQAVSGGRGALCCDLKHSRSRPDDQREERRGGLEEEGARDAATDILSDGEQGEAGCGGVAGQRLRGSCARCV